MSLQLVVMVTEFRHRYHYQVVTLTSQFLHCSGGRQVGVQVATTVVVDR